MGHGYQNQCGSHLVHLCFRQCLNSEMQTQKNDEFSLLTLHRAGAQSILLNTFIYHCKVNFFKGRTGIKTLVSCTNLIASIHCVWFCGMFCLRSFRWSHQMEIMLKYLPGLHLSWFFILAEILLVTWLKLKHLPLDLEMTFRLRLLKIKQRKTAQKKHLRQNLMIKASTIRRHLLLIWWC